MTQIPIEQQIKEIYWCDGMETIAKNISTHNIIFQCPCQAFTSFKSRKYDVLRYKVIL